MYARAVAKATKPTCFVITPIGKDGSDIRKWADQTFKHLIQPVVEGLGFSALRADQEDRAGIITTHIIQRLVTSELVVADLTNRNPNVFYELAVRHVTRKPLVQIIREDEEIPFDVQGMRAVKFQLADPDILESAKKQLARSVEAVKDEEKLDTPISQAVDLQIALESDDPNQVSLGALASAVQDLTAEVRAQRPARPDTTVVNVDWDKVDFPKIKIPDNLTALGKLELGSLEKLQPVDPPKKRSTSKKRKRKKSG